MFKKSQKIILIVFSSILLFSCVTLVETKNKSSNKEIKIKYIEAENFPEDFHILSLNAKKIDNEAVFTLHTSSEIKRGFSFFNPPEGNILMCTNQLTKGNTNCSFNILIEDLEKCQNITMKFKPWKNEIYIFLNMYDIKRLLKN